MGWYSFIALMSDWRVQFLIGFVLLAISVAIVLTVIDIRLKKKNVAKLVKVVDNSPVGKMKRFLDCDKSSREKLDFVNNVAKIYFGESYGTSLSSDYFALVKKLRERQAKRKDSPLLYQDEIRFCEYMFAAYYSQKELSDSEVRTLGRMLVNIDENKKRRAVTVSHEMSFGEKVSGFFNEEVGADKKYNEKVKKEVLAEDKSAVEKREKEEVVKIQKKALEDAKKERDLEAARAKLLEEDESSRKYQKQEAMTKEKKEKFSGVNFSKLKSFYTSSERESKFSEAKGEKVEVSNKTAEDRKGAGVAERIIIKEKDRLDKFGVLQN